MPHDLIPFSAGADLALIESDLDLAHKLVREHDDAGWSLY
jgi:hypothetical protein